jgi:hypothetical protein
MAEHYLIIFRTGAGGGTLVHALAPSDRRIMPLERGGFLPKERDTWDHDAVFVKARSLSLDT